MSGLWNGEGLIPCFRAISCSHNACLLPFFTLYHYFMKWLPFFFLGCCIAFGEEIRGGVINVIDGDTIVVLEKTPEEKIVHKVRLEGIDAPERGQDGYDGAKHYLEKLIWGETVTVRYIGRDRYGRILGLVVYGTASVDEEMVRDGWAWRYKHSTSRKLASHESEARAGKKGLWSEPSPIPPWEWKAEKRKEDGTKKRDK